MHHGRVLPVDERADLPAGGLDDVRVTVTGTRDADTGGEVEIPTSVGAVDVAPLGVVDGDGRCLQQAG